MEATLGELNRLFESFISISKQITPAMAKSPIRIPREAKRTILNRSGMAMTVTRSQQWPSTLQHSAFYAMTWKRGGSTGITRLTSQEVIKKISF